MQGYVSISIEEWAEIQSRLAKLDALEAGGVDNWPGYGDCFEDDEEEDDDE